MKRGLGDTDTGSFTLKEKLSYALSSVVILGGSFLIGRKMVKNKRANNEEDKTFDEGTTATYAKQVKMALHNDGWWGADTVQLRSVLTQIPSQQEFERVMKSYEKMNNSSMMKDMGKELDTTEYNEMLSIIHAKPKKNGGTIDMSVKYDDWAKRLKAAFDKTYGPFPGTDRGAIKAVFYEIPTQADYAQVGVAYNKLYNTNLDNDLKGELHFWELSDFTDIIKSKPQS
jgi:hypothetical protein